MCARLSSSPSSGLLSTGFAPILRISSSKSRSQAFDFLNDHLPQTLNCLIFRDLTSRAVASEPAARIQTALLAYWSLALRSATQTTIGYLHSPQIPHHCHKVRFVPNFEMVILDEKTLMLPRPPPYVQNEPVSPPPFPTQSRAPPTLSTLSPHLLLRIVYETFSQGRVERQRKVLYWLTMSLRLVNRSVYLGEYC